MVDSVTVDSRAEFIAESVNEQSTNTWLQLIVTMWGFGLEDFQQMPEVWIFM